VALGDPFGAGLSCGTHGSSMHVVRRTGPDGCAVERVMHGPSSCNVHPIINLGYSQGPPMLAAPHAPRGPLPWQHLAAARPEPTWRGPLRSSWAGLPARRGLAEGNLGRFPPACRSIQAGALCAAPGSAPGSACGGVCRRRWACSSGDSGEDAGAAAALSTVPGPARCRSQRMVI
jgi:hypothetical protein